MKFQIVKTGEIVEGQITYVANQGRSILTYFSNSTKRWETTGLQVDHVDIMKNEVIKTELLVIPYKFL